MQLPWRYRLSKRDMVWIDGDARTPPRQVPAIDWLYDIAKQVAGGTVKPPTLLNHIWLEYELDMDDTDDNLVTYELMGHDLNKWRF